METVLDYNSKHWGKAWFIVGMTRDGAAYCCSCAEAWPLNDESPNVHPVFMSDEFDGRCDRCDEVI